ncbi:MAG TPA: alpha/beta fold hydrolase [Burkholderiaceae bacterium]|nr:alpha/beta fold hydrolase [Burkholderiaceae bacterium]
MPRIQDPEQLWIEMPPISRTAPRRLIAFLHGAGSSPEVFAPIAVAWQLKFPGATAAVLQGLERRAEGCDWFDARDRCGLGPERVLTAANRVAARIEQLQRSLKVASADTIVVGFSQGATVALELARSCPDRLAIVVAYAGRLACTPRSGDRIDPTVHLIHGEFDSVVPSAFGAQAYRRLRGVGADVTLDIVADEAHTIGQALVNLGTARVMQTLFRGRKPACRPTLH